MYYSYNMYIPFIYLSYNMDISFIYHSYSMYISFIYNSFIVHIACSDTICSLGIHTTLQNAVMVTTYRRPFPTQTAWTLWVVRPQLFFQCTLCPINAAKGLYNCSQDDSDIDLDLVFFSAFEDLRLHTSGTMETNGIRKLYEPSPVPTL